MRCLASGLLRYDKPPKLASTLRGGGHFHRCQFFGHFERGLCPEIFFEKATSIFDWRFTLRSTLEKWSASAFRPGIRLQKNVPEILDKENWPAIRSQKNALKIMNIAIRPGIVLEKNAAENLHILKKRIFRPFWTAIVVKKMQNKLCTFSKLIFRGHLLTFLRRIAERIRAKKSSRKSPEVDGYSLGTPSPPSGVPQFDYTQASSQCIDSLVRYIKSRHLQWIFRIRSMNGYPLWMSLSCWGWRPWRRHPRS